jgi:malonyl-ACP O-methyltransferase BioC
VTDFLEKKFSRAADTYLDIALVQKEAARRVCEYFPVQFHPKRVLEIGCGPGVLTGLLLQRFQEAELESLDLSKRMLDQLSSELASPRLELTQVDFLDFNPLGTYDLVVSSSSIHWVPDILAAFKKVYSLLEPNSPFVFSLMIEGTLAELRQLRAMITPDKEVYPHFHSAYEVLAMLEEAGFDVKTSEDRRYIEVHPDTRQLFESLKNRGVTASNEKSTQLSREELVRLIKEYDSRFQTENGEGVKASYEVLRVFALKPPAEA